MIANNSVDNYALELIDAYCAWSISHGSPNILIGIADTEFERTHEDLTNQIISLDGQSSSNHQHGTRVSGLACAETNNYLGVSGIGYNSKIAAHRIPHWEDGSASSSEIRAAIWDLYQDGVPIINISWSGSGLDVAAAQEITQNGTVLVLAAGNSPTAQYHSSIANIPGVIIVSGVNKNNEHGPTNHAHNEWVDICAPSVAIITTFPNNSYSVIWGTSGAAPQVAGTIALMLEVNPFLTPAIIEEFIKETADPISDEASFEGLIGEGRINAYQALIKAGTKNYNNFAFWGSIIRSAGYGFNLSNVVLAPATDLVLRARKEVNIINDFEVPLGSTFEIDINASIRCDQYFFE